MGGDRAFSHDYSTEDGSSLDLEFPEQTSDLPSPFSEGVLGSKIENGSANGDIDMDFDKTVDTGYKISPNSLRFDADQRWARNIYAEVLASYSVSPCRSVGLEEAKRTILSYRPGSWIEKVGGLKLDDYYLPETTTILLIGPKGSGKSSLINRISEVFENDKFASERAQVSYQSSGEGTYFLHEYMVPRDSNAFCLFDTRSMSNDALENMKVLKHWMTKGVHHGELVKRASDDANLKSRMKYKARHICCSNGKVRMVNFVIMVVNGLSVLESMDSGDPEKKQYTEMIAKAFNSPFLSFKDDKPLIVVTHGDLLAIPDRVRIRIHLGELLGVPPKTQVFDIPESNNLTTELAVTDLLRHCLEHADSNLPMKRHRTLKMDATSLSALLLLLVVLAISIIFTFMPDARFHRGHKRFDPSEVHIDWHAIRHLWMD